MTTKEISNSDDVIDIREVIERYEALETELEDDRSGTGGSVSAMSFEDYLTHAAADDTHTLQDAASEALLLKALIDECRGNGGDEQWRGDWYPVTLIRDSYFRDYAEELADDIGAINKDASWPNTFIDWDAAAEALQQDYTAVEFDGVTYWVR